MSFPSHAAQESAIAFQLAATLDAYEQELGRLRLVQPAPDTLAQLAQHFDQMQLYAASLPQLSVSWVALLISRAEFTHDLWRAQGAPEPGNLQILLEQHKEAIDGLRSRCRRMLRRA